MIANINIAVPPGMRYPCKDIVAVGGEHSNLIQNVEVAARQVGYEISHDSTPEELFFVRSDQYSFVKQGVPAFMAAEWGRWRRRGQEVAGNAIPHPFGQYGSEDLLRGRAQGGEIVFSYRIQCCTTEPASGMEQR